MKVERLRRALVILSVGVSLYYLVWRLGTLNKDAMTFSLIVYGAEVYGFIASLMFFFMVWKLSDRKPKPPPKGLKVDVFIPTLNESTDILRKTIQGALSMRYPHKTYVLDDGNRPEVRRLCNELGCEYIARTRNEHGKAGNLNNALSRTDGEFIAIFDADHVPEPDFLEKTLGYFEDEKVAFVQTPQDFYNVDSFIHRVVKGKLWSEESLFYKVIMRGKDRHNAAFFCGSCAVIRRRALEDIGGFAIGSVTEDLHTSIKLHAKGWKSVYHPEPLAYGIAPPTVRPYRTQRERWGQGAMQIFLRDNPIFKRGLTLAQRISYIASMTTYFDGFQKAIFYTAPVYVLLTGVYPISVSMEEFLPVFLPHIALSLWAFEEMSRGRGKFLILEQYNMARFFSFMKSVLGFFKKPIFKVSDKKNGSEVFMREVLPQGTVLLASLVGISYAFLNLNSLPNRDVYMANIFWAGLNMAIAGACLLWTLRKRHKRGKFRFPANFPALLRSDEFTTAVSVEDIHESGAALISQREIRRGDRVKLHLSFQDKELELEGEVIYSYPLPETGLYRHGVKFVALNPEKIKEINEICFRFLVKKYMDEHDRPFHTPLSYLISLFNRHPKRKDKRFGYHIPGLIFSDGEFIPYTTEDVGEHGVRILTYLPLRNKRLSLSLGEAQRMVSGRIVWSKEINFYGIRVFRYGIRVEEETTPSVEESLSPSL